MIISYLKKKDAQALALTSKRMYDLTLNRLWSKPSYKYTKDLDFLKKISKFPIQELRMGDFHYNGDEISVINEEIIIKIVPQLKLLHMDWDFRYILTEPEYITCASVPLILHTKVLWIHDEDDFNGFLKMMKKCVIAKLIVDHSDDYDMLLWSPEQLSKVVGQTATEVCVNSLDINEETIEKFWQILSTSKNCKLYFPFEEDKSGHSFTVKDIELLAKYDVQISWMSSSVLKNGELLCHLSQFSQALMKLKHLERFEFRTHSDNFLPPVELFKDLPIFEIRTDEFDLGYGKINAVVDTLSQIRSLLRIHITSPSYKFSLEDLALFRTLPVKKVELTALLLTKENIPEFRQLFKQMNIEEIVNELDNFDFEHSIWA